MRGKGRSPSVGRSHCRVRRHHRRWRRPRRRRRCTSRFDFLLHRICRLRSAPLCSAPLCGLTRQECFLLPSSKSTSSLVSSKQKGRVTPSILAAFLMINVRASVLSALSVRRSRTGPPRTPRHDRASNNHVFIALVELITRSSRSSTEQRATRVRHATENLLQQPQNRRKKKSCRIRKMTENVFIYLHARDVYTLYFPCFVCKIPRRFNCCQNGHQEPYERGSPLRKEKSRAGLMRLAQTIANFAHGKKVQQI